MWNERYHGDRCSVWKHATFKNIFGLGGGPAPPPPTPAPPPTMPDLFGPAALEAQRRAQANAMSSGGRQSTILTTPFGTRGASTIAGGAPAGAKLGSS